MKRPFWAGLVLVGLGLATCFAAQADSPGAVMEPSSGAAKVAPTHTIYLTGHEKLWRDFPKAPALGSEVDEEDLLITLAAQAARTDDQKNEAITDQHYSITLITGVVGPDFETKYPDVLVVLKNAENDAFVITSMLKKENARLRPYVQHPTLVVPLFAVRDFSYPSGHASGSELQARLLAVLYPDRADDLLKRARQVADGRVVAGVHYASDTEAGQKLGDLIFEQLEANPRFRRDLAAAAQKDSLTLK